MLVGQLNRSMITTIGYRQRQTICAQQLQVPHVATVKSILVLLVILAVHHSAPSTAATSNLVMGPLGNRVCNYCQAHVDADDARDSAIDQKHHIVIGLEAFLAAEEKALRDQMRFLEYGKTAGVQNREQTSRTPKERVHIAAINGTDSVENSSSRPQTKQDQIQITHLPKTNSTPSPIQEINLLSMLAALSSASSNATVEDHVSKVPHNLFNTSIDIKNDTSDKFLIVAGKEGSKNDNKSAINDVMALLAPTASGKSNMAMSSSVEPNQTSPPLLPLNSSVTAEIEPIQLQIEPGVAIRPSRASNDPSNRILDTPELAHIFQEDDGLRNIDVRGQSAAARIPDGNKKKEPHRRRYSKEQGRSHIRRPAGRRNETWNVESDDFLASTAKLLEEIEQNARELDIRTTAPLIALDIPGLDDDTAVDGNSTDAAEPSSRILFEDAFMDEDEERSENLGKVAGKQPKYEIVDSKEEANSSKKHSEAEGNKKQIPDGGNETGSKDNGRKDSIDDTFFEERGQKRVRIKRKHALPLCTRQSKKHRVDVGSISDESMPGADLENDDDYAYYNPHQTKGADSAEHEECGAGGDDQSDEERCPCHECNCAVCAKCVTSVGRRRNNRNRPGKFGDDDYDDMPMFTDKHYTDADDESLCQQCASLCRLCPNCLDCEKTPTEVVFRGPPLPTYNVTGVDQLNSSGSSNDVDKEVKTVVAVTVLVEATTTPSSVKPTTPNKPTTIANRSKTSQKATSTVTVTTPTTSASLSTNATSTPTTSLTTGSTATSSTNLPTVTTAKKNETQDSVQKQRAAESGHNVLNPEQNISKEAFAGKQDGNQASSVERVTEDDTKLRKLLVKYLASRVESSTAKSTLSHGESYVKGSTPPPVAAGAPGHPDWHSFYHIPPSVHSQHLGPAVPSGLEVQDHGHGEHGPPLDPMIVHHDFARAPVQHIMHPWQGPGASGGSMGPWVGKLASSWGGLHGQFPRRGPPAWWKRHPRRPSYSQHAVHRPHNHQQLQPGYNHHYQVRRAAVGASPQRFKRLSDRSIVEEAKLNGTEKVDSKKTLDPAEAAEKLAESKFPSVRLVGSFLGPRKCAPFKLCSKKFPGSDKVIHYCC